MRLPDDYEEKENRMSPTVVSAVVAVTLFVGALLIVVLLMNQTGTHRKPNHTKGENVFVPESAESGTDDFVFTGGSLTPDDLDFWDKYPVAESFALEETKGTKPEEPSASAVPVDPSEDGKHTLVKNRDGREEWVLISPYLPKHTYDFTKLVCQSDVMRYYEDGKQVSFLGADISKYQEYVDFNRLKSSGVSFVMLRVGARGYSTGQLLLDDRFAENLKQASDAGLQIGVYFSSQAITQEEAVEEANLVLSALGDVRLTYPVAFDMSFAENDSSRIEALSKTEKTDIAITFLDTVKNAGYMGMIYGNKEWLIKEVDLSRLTGYDIWLSQLQDVPDYPYRFSIWQYSQTASISGISGYANLNISFIDYSEK